MEYQQLIKSLQDRIIQLEKIASKLPVRFAHADAGGSVNIEQATATQTLTQGEICTATLDSSGEEINVLITDGNAPTGSTFLATKIGSDWVGWGIGQYVWFGLLKADLAPQGSVEVSRIMGLDATGAPTLFDPEQIVTAIDIFDYSGAEGDRCKIEFQAGQWVFMDVECSSQDQQNEQT